jgi:hypothetical protein
VAWLAEAHLLAGHHDEALRLGRQALALARAHKERGHAAHVLRLLGDIAASRPGADLTEAGRHLLEALALANELEMQPLLARCHASLARLHELAGDHEAARASLESAAGLCERLGMRAPAARAPLREPG